MRKVLLASLMALCVSVPVGNAFAQMGHDGMGQQGQMGMMGNCPMMGRGMMMMPGMTPQQAENYQKFQTDTQPLQQKLMNDQAELNSVLNQDNPDPKKVKELNQRIAETQAELQIKARKYGLMGYRMW